MLLFKISQMLLYSWLSSFFYRNNYLTSQKNKLLKKKYLFPDFTLFSSYVLLQFS